MTATDKPMPTWLEAAWMQRYLERELTPAETEWFEVYVLDKPELLALIETDLNLRDGVAGTGAAVAPVVQLRDVRSAGEVPQRRHRSRGKAWFAQAAAIVVSASLGWWAATTHVAAPDATGGEVIADPVRIVFDTQRGEEGSPLVFNADSDSRYLLVEVGVPMGATDVRLMQASQPPRSLTVTSEGFVTFLWPRDGKGSAPSPSLSFVTDGDTVTRSLDLSRALKGDTR